MSEREKITVTYFDVQNDLMVVANLGIRINKLDMYLGKLKLIEKKDGSYYVAPPSESYKDVKTGEKKYANLWWFGEKTSRMFQSECIKAINRFCHKKNINNPMVKQ